MVIGLLFLGLISSSAVAQCYVVTKLGTLGGANSQPLDINDRGQVVGWAEARDGSVRPFLWQDGKLSELGTVGRAFAINARGQVVIGDRLPQGTGGHVVGMAPGASVIWDNGRTTDLGFPAGPLRTNGRGQVVGTVATAGDRPGEPNHRAMLWQQGRLVDIGTLGGKSSFGRDVNESGQVVGTSWTADGKLAAFIWGDGQISKLGTLQEAHAINDRGQVVGLEPKQGMAVGVIWEDGRTTELGWGKVPSGINNHGQVVGVEYDARSRTSRAFLWYDGRSITFPHEIRSFGPRINDDGQIVLGRVVGDAVQAVLYSPEADCSGAYRPPPTLLLSHAVWPPNPEPGGDLRLALRLTNLDREEVQGIELHVLFIEEEGSSPAKDISVLEGRCRGGSEGGFDCRIERLAAGASIDLQFAGALPRAGGLGWIATWNTTSRAWGERSQAGRIGPDDAPEILEVIVLEKQEEIWNGVASYGYPFAGGTEIDNSTRDLLIVGWNLPQAPGDKVELESDDESVRYGLLDFPQSGHDYYQRRYREGWERFYTSRGRPPAFEPPSDLQGLLIRARLSQGILPGNKTLRVSGSPGFWDLRFGALNGRIRFVRRTGADRTEEIATAYRPERIYVEVRTNHDLPIDQIAVKLRTENLDLNGRTAFDLMLRRDPSLGERVYISKPVNLIDRDIARLAPPDHDAGDQLSLPVKLQAGKPLRLSAEVDRGFRYSTFALAIDPPVATIRVASSPGQDGGNWHWKRALGRAAACRDDVRVTDWDALSSQQAEEIWNIVVLEYMLGSGSLIQSQKVTLGHQAAAIMLRDMFKQMMQRTLERLAETKGDREKAKGFLNTVKALDWFDGQSFLGPLEVTSPAGLASPAYMVLDVDVVGLAKDYDTTPAKIREWQLDAMIEALTKLSDGGKAALEEADDTGDCDVEDLIKLTGFSFEPVAVRLIPKLVKLQVHRGAGGRRFESWVPDREARKRVTQLGPLAAAIKAQQQKASEDTDLLLAVTALAGAPLMLAENFLVVLASASLNIFDFAVTSVHEVSQLMASRWEVAFSEGAALVIGPQRHERAVREAKGWASTTFAIGTSALGAATGVLGVWFHPEQVIARSAARGYWLSQDLTRGTRSIGTFTAAEQRDLATFATLAKVRQIAKGAESLTAMERTAIETIDAFATERLTTSATEVAPAKIGAGDAALPESTVPRFRIDPETGTPTLVKAEHLPGIKPEAAGTLPRPPPAAASAAPQTGAPGPLFRELEEGVTISLVDAAGKEIEVTLGKRIGGGSFNEVWAVKGNDEVIVRVTRYVSGRPSAQLEQFGRDVLVEIDSPHIRVVKEEHRYDLPPDVAKKKGYHRIAINKRVTETAMETIERQGGVMSRAQQQAFEDALRDLNRRGYAWLDNKWDNFAFEEVDRRTVVVVLDPGSIVRLKGSAIRAASAARELQLLVNGPFLDIFPRYPGMARVFRSELRKDEIRQRFADRVDLQAIGADDLRQVPFNPRSGEDFDYIGPSFAQEGP